MVSPSTENWFCMRNLIWIKYADLTSYNINLFLIKVHSLLCYNLLLLSSLFKIFCCMLSALAILTSCVNSTRTILFSKYLHAGVVTHTVCQIICDQN